MSNRFLVSVAAIALIAGAGAANAQGTGNRESGGAAMQHSAPSGTTATPAARDSGGSSDVKSSQSEQTAPGAAKGQRAEESAPGQKSKGMSSQNETKGGKDMKAETREGQTGNMKAEGREGRDANKNAESREGRDTNKNAEGREGRETNKNAESREGRDNSKMNAETKTGGERSQTTGQAGASGKLTTEQRTKITTVIRSEHVQPVTNVNFNISVGTRIPRDISYHALPTEVVTIYPEWRGYNYVLVRSQIIVIDPETFEIVAVLDA